MNHELIIGSLGSSLFGLFIQPFGIFDLKFSPANLTPVFRVSTFYYTFQHNHIEIKNYEACENLKESVSALMGST